MSDRYEEMSDYKKNRLPKDAQRRIWIWHLALGDALTKLKVAEHLWVTTFEKLASIPDLEKPLKLEVLEFEAGGLPHSVNVPLAAYEGLVGAAIVLYCQVFSSGKGGNGIVSNKASEIKALRGEMVSSTRKALGWTSQEFDDFNQLIQDRRNKQLAHYDGQDAGYRELPNGNASLKGIGANLKLEETVKLIHIIEPMYEFTRQNL